ncbi:hypothetical protein 7AX1_117 [uncultured Caudovirales phage]|uniref:Uncharacterized protein n=1 Tax=uncultured Caudovirales phage TaxID=2100421 RepID=A0A2H4IYX7_9CAUD|nr:hypothetical protein 7AX1_117 [uncultured Caudovirales phage]
MIFYFIILVLTAVSLYIGVTRFNNFFYTLATVGFVTLILILYLPKSFALRESTSTVISAEQFNEIASVSSVDVKAHESNKSYIKKTTYTVSKKSKIYFITGHRELDTKYDVYIKK